MVPPPPSPESVSQTGRVGSGGRWTDRATQEYPTVGPVTADFQPDLRDGRWPSLRPVRLRNNILLDMTSHYV